MSDIRRCYYCAEGLAAPHYAGLPRHCTAPKCDICKKCASARLVVVDSSAPQEPE